MKIHIKVHGKAVCGTRQRKNKLRFAKNDNEATCGNCKRVTAR